MSFRRAAVSLCAVLLSTLLGACAALAPRDAGPRAEPFDVLGRVLVRYDGNAFSSNLRWQHGAGHDELWLMTPTGQALAHMREDGGGATLTAADQTQYRGSSVESLTRQGLGWELPLTRLQHWMRGHAAPHIAAEITARDDTGRATRITQDGWRIIYEYSDAPEYERLPRRIEMASDAQSIRLVIDSWRRESPAGETSPGIFITR